MLTRNMGTRPFEVQQFTGYATSTNPKGNWDRGILYRGHTVVFRSSARNLFMYDPTNPLTWNNANF